MELNQDKSCFVCNRDVQNNGVTLCTETTLYSNTPFTTMLMQILGEEFMLVVLEDDKICLKCNNLINQTDGLMQDLMEKQGIIKKFLNKKYDLNDTIEAVDVTMEAVDGGGYSSDEGRDYVDSPGEAVPAASLSEPRIKVEVNRSKVPQPKAVSGPAGLDQQQGPQPQKLPQAKPRAKAHQSRALELTNQQPCIEFPGGRDNSSIYGDNAGYYYRCEKIYKGIRNLRCTRYKYGCFARAVMTTEPNAPICVTKTSPMHSHPPDLLYGEKMLLLKRLKDRAIEESGKKLSEIIDDELSRSPHINLSKTSATRNLLRYKRLRLGPQRRLRKYELLQQQKLLQQQQEQQEQELQQQEQQEQILQQQLQNEQNVAVVQVLDNPTIDHMYLTEMVIGS